MRNIDKNNPKKILHTIRPLINQLGTTGICPHRSDYNGRRTWDLAIESHTRETLFLCNHNVMHNFELDN